MSDDDDTFADDDLPPDDCGFHVDEHGQLFCPKAGTEECSSCSVALEFEPGAIAKMGTA